MQTPFPMDELDPDLYQRRVEGLLDNALARITDLEACIQIIKDACDRDWKDETPAQIATIVSNAMFWRNKKIQELRDRLADAEIDEINKEWDVE